MDAAHAGGLGGTYGGNPVACAAALGSIETMAKEDLPAAARRIGDLMLPRLRKLAEQYPVIGDVRGRGAMIAISASPLSRSWTMSCAGYCRNANPTLGAASRNAFSRPGTRLVATECRNPSRTVPESG